MNKKILKDHLEWEEKRKRYKNSAMSQKKFVISMLICILVIEAYFIFNYFMSDNLLSDMKSLIKEM